MVGLAATRLLASLPAWKGAQKPASLAPIVLEGLKWQAFITRHNSLSED